MKKEELSNWFRERRRVSVAFSGGTDSAFLLAFAASVLPRNDLLGIIVDSPLVPRAELNDALAFAGARDIPVETVCFNPLSLPVFSENPPDRCYRCKHEMMNAIIVKAIDCGFEFLADGTNADDKADERPGQQALRELGVSSPLQELGITKIEIREWSREMNLPTADKASQACLATRIPNGIPVTAEKLMSAEKEEALLHELGFAQCRARQLPHSVSIEVSADKLGEARARWNEISIRLSAVSPSSVSLAKKPYGEK